MNKANKNFYVGAFLAGSLGQWIIWEITQVLILVYPQLLPIRQIRTIPASLLTILSGIVTCILVYKMWAAIQGRGARTTAGRALGFTFIPLFNFYWFFQVYWGWTKDYNRIHESEDVQLPSMPEGIALAVCILPLLSMCLVIANYFGGGWENFAEAAAVNIRFQASMLVGLVNTILMALLYSKICDGINALIDAGLAPAKPQYAVPPEDVKTSGRAIASLVLGICGIFTCGLPAIGGLVLGICRFCTAGLTAIVGLILGIVSLSAIRKSQGFLKGTGLAIAGIAVSGMILLMMLIVIAIKLPVIAGENPFKWAKSIHNTRMICLAANLYCDDNEGSFPPVENWPDVLKPYIDNEKILVSPYAPEAGRAWAMNKNLDGRKRQDIKQPDRTVLIFESRFNGPPSGDSELLPENPRVKIGYIIGFVDGHTELVHPDRLDELIWTPGNQPLLEDR